MLCKVSLQTAVVLDLPDVPGGGGERKQISFSGLHLLSSPHHISHPKTSTGITVLQRIIPCSTLSPWLPEKLGGRDHLPCSIEHVVVKHSLMAALWGYDGVCCEYLPYRCLEQLLPILNHAKHFPGWPT